MTDQEFNKILRAIASYPEGASLQQILKHVPMEKRTLQRRLTQLVDRGKITVSGASRARRYNVIEFPPKAIEEKPESTFAPSPEGETIWKAVRRPFHERSYANYDRTLLDAYVPNETYYLPAKQRAQLLEWGRTDGERPVGTYARHIFNRLLIDLAWNSSRLEGNTYSLLETERLLELSEIAEGKDLLETQMLLNHKAAIEFLVESEEELPLNRTTLVNLHALLSENLLKDPTSSGKLRAIPIGIAKSTYIPLAIPPVLEECFNLIAEKSAAIEDPFEQAFFLMVHIPYLQPFEDVNKRVSRLAANIPFIRQNLCPLSFVGMPTDAYVTGLLGIYELKEIDLFRDVFIWAYERSCYRYATVRRSVGEPDPFRLQYRQEIRKIVTQIVRARHDKKQAVAAIRTFATRLPEEARAQFLETVEVELGALHEGNIARYRLRPSDFSTWHGAWK